MSLAYLSLHTYVCMHIHYTVIKGHRDCVVCIYHKNKERKVMAFAVRDHLIITDLSS